MGRSLTVQVRRINLSRKDVEVRSAKMLCYRLLLVETRKIDKVFEVVGRETLVTKVRQCIENIKYEDCPLKLIVDRGIIV